MEQGTPEWYQVRLGVPTASRFKEIYTSTGKASVSAEAYMNTLIAEKLAGKYLESFTSEWMQRGTEMEAEAKTLYELEKDVELQTIGFVTNDAGTVGGSPDAMNLEVKCPAPHTHIKYMLANKCPSEYYPQVQGYMWICEQDHWDFMSYHPDLPVFIINVQRDDEYITGLEREIEKFLAKMAEKLKLLEQRD